MDWETWLGLIEVLERVWVEWVRKRHCLLQWIPEEAKTDGYGTHPPDVLGHKLL